MFRLVPTPSSPPPHPPVARRLPSHKLTIFERDPAGPIVVGSNPHQIAQLDLVHELTIPRREAAAAALVKLHTTRAPVEINHCPGGALTAIVLKG